MASTDYENISPNPERGSFHYDYYKKYAGSVNGHSDRDELVNLWHDYLTTKYEDNQSKVNAFCVLLLNVYLEIKESKKTHIYSREDDRVVNEVYARLDSIFEELFARRKCAENLQVNSKISSYVACCYIKHTQVIILFSNFRMM